jgi:hypothetical protein
MSSATVLCFRTNGQSASKGEKGLMLSLVQVFQRKEFITVLKYIFMTGPNKEDNP